MPLSSPHLPIVVSHDSYISGEAHQVVASNVSFVNQLFASGVGPAFIADDSLRSYYVDYYHAQTMNGGFSQYVFNSRWNEDANCFLKEGLANIGATDNAELFCRGERLVVSTAGKLRKFFASAYFGKNIYRSFLDSISRAIIELDSRESLVTLNAAWLLRHPRLRVLSIAEMYEQIEHRKAASVAAQIQ